MPRIALRRALNYSIAITIIATAALAAPRTCPADGPSKPMSQKDKLEMVLKYQRLVTITEGKGLYNVTLGMPFATVLKQLGQPQQKRGMHIVSITRDWVYTLGPRTQLRVAGSKVVDAIMVAGSRGSPYMTAAGAGFGMSPPQVDAFYTGNPVLNSPNIHDYPTLGTRFVFQRGVLSEIIIYPAQRP